MYDEYLETWNKQIEKNIERLKDKYEKALVKDNKYKLRIKTQIRDEEEKIVL